MVLRYPRFAADLHSNIFLILLLMIWACLLHLKTHYLFYYYFWFIQLKYTISSTQPINFNDYLLQCQQEIEKTFFLISKSYIYVIKKGTRGKYKKFIELPHQLMTAVTIYLGDDCINKK